MTRGEGALNKVHYAGSEEDFLVFVDDISEYENWKTDKTIPMAQFIGTFKVYITHKQGAEGQYDAASKGTMENEFGTSNQDDVIKAILEKGNLQATKQSGRQGDRNDTQGARQAH